MPVRLITVSPGLDLAETMRGTKAPLMIGPTEAKWSTRTPDGLGTLRIQRRDEVTVIAESWGPGKEWMLDQAPRLLGSEDNSDGFMPVGKIDRMWKEHPIILGRTDRPWDSIVAGIFGQKVQVENAKKSRRLLAKKFGDLAPGPNPGWILPSPQVVAQLGYYELNPLGIERKRADTLSRAAREMSRLDDLTKRTPIQVQTRLKRIRGIGPWTAAMVTATAMGDPDAVPLGDYHLPNTVAWAMAGEARADDRRMLELLAPYIGHRWRVLRLVKRTGSAPKFGPKLDLRGDGLHKEADGGP